MKEKQYITVAPTVGDREEAAALVRAGEEAFDARLDAVAEEICRACTHDDVRIVRLSGPTCAGKTTTARKLTSALEAAGCTVYPISLDDFFYGRDVLEAFAAEDPEGKLDYDSVEALDLDRLGRCVRELMETGRAEIPVFDFTTGYANETRLLDTTAHPEEKPVFLFEGIQAVYPEVVEMFRDVPNRSIFINVECGIRIADSATVVEPDEIRLMRRIVRDEAKRATDPAFTLWLWHSVRDNEEKSILPYADGCDFRIDSVMPFELHMLAPHLRRVLGDHPVRGEEAAAADALLRKLEGVTGIDADLISENSLYHEFIVV